jgi:hypothetical protein
MCGRRVLSVGARVCALFTATALVAALGALTGASAALASEPTGEFAIFKECPRFTSGVNLYPCLYTKTLGGEVTIGRQTLPLERPLVLQGGIERLGEEPTLVETFVGALNGETLSRAPQKVPGGLFGMPLEATLELAPGSEVQFSLSNLENEEGTAVVLPVRMRLENPLLGSDCYVGSRSSPIVLHLTTGTTSPSPPNRPISGRLGMISARDVFEWFEVSGDVMVDNTFSMPGASGCGGSGNASLVDSAIDRDLGLPSPDGYNTIVEDNAIFEASPQAVIASEGK